MNEKYMALAQELMRRCYAEDEEVEVQRWLEEQVIKHTTVEDEAVLKWLESFDWYDALLEKRAKESSMPPEERRTLDFPWPSWNNMIDPLDPGMLMVVSAPDGQGKTIVGEQLIEWWAMHRNHCVFVHYELNRALMMDRRTARHTSINRRILKSGILSADEIKAYNDMKPVLKAWDGSITYVHTPGWNMDKTLQELKALRYAKLCDVVVIDYLEKVSASNRQVRLYGTSQVQREADNVEMLKTFAEANEIPVVMIAQFSKEGKKTDGSDMDRTAIRGAGEKTEKANVVVLLKREKGNEGDGTAYSSTVDVTIDKNTVGATGKFKQIMEPEFFRMTDLSLY